MSLKVKDEETCRAASELAQRTGDTLAAAIALVLREHLAREVYQRQLYCLTINVTLGP